METKVGDSKKKSGFWSTSKDLMLGLDRFPASAVQINLNGKDVLNSFFGFSITILMYAVLLTYGLRKV